MVVDPALVGGLAAALRVEQAVLYGHPGRAVRRADGDDLRLDLFLVGVGVVGMDLIARVNHSFSITYAPPAKPSSDSVQR